MNMHTPGPWRIGNLESYDGYTGQPFRNIWAGQDDSATVVARAIRSQGAMTNDVDADARLIAAAPELLDIAESILADDMLQFLPTEYVAKVRATIAKATGSAS